MIIIHYSILSFLIYRTSSVLLRARGGRRPPPARTFLQQARGGRTFFPVCHPLSTDPPSRNKRRVPKCDVYQSSSYIQLQILSRGFPMYLMSHYVDYVRIHTRLHPTFVPVTKSASQQTQLFCLSVLPQFV
jgi:hypothetical protein